jgi:Mg-chelatase subunit ChlD
VPIAATAIVTVTSADDDLAPDDDPGGTEIIMIDCSGSMARHGKIAAARQAAAVAIDAIRDGVTFAVVAGNQGTCSPAARRLCGTPSC